MGYDQESGLVYSETVQRCCKCLQHSLSNANGYQKPKEKRSHQTRSLWDMVRRRLLQNLDGVGPESLAATPLPVLERIWPERLRYQIHFRLWKAMAQSQPSLVSARPYSITYVCQSCRRLPDMLQIADCPTYDWLCDLTIDSDYVTPDELFRVSDLRNIRRFEFCGGKQNKVTDRVIRSWADSAAEHGAFSKLEAITIDQDNGQRGRAEGVTAASLNRLQSFKALQQFCVHQEKHLLVDRTTIGDYYGAFRRSLPKKCPNKHVRKHGPVLQVFIGKSGRAGVYHGGLTACFKRSSSTPLASEQASQAPPCEQHTASKRRAKRLKRREEGSAAQSKRRKLKDGRSLALDELIAGM